MRSALVVIHPPGLDLPPSFGQRVEPVYVQALVPERAVEALDMGTVRWRRGAGKVQANFVVVGPEIDDLTGELVPLSAKNFYR